MNQPAMGQTGHGRLPSPYVGNLRAATTRMIHVDAVPRESATTPPTRPAFHHHPALRMTEATPRRRFHTRPLPHPKPESRDGRRPSENRSEAEARSDPLRRREGVAAPAAATVEPKDQARCRSPFSGRVGCGHSRHRGAHQPSRSSWKLTGSEQQGHVPPHPIRRMKMPHSQRCSPSRRVPHSGHS